MHLFSIIFLGIAANIDNLGIGLAYGTRSIKIPFFANLIIAIMSGAATLITSYVGHLLEYILPIYFCNIIGGGIVSLVGIYVMLMSLCNKKDTDSPAEPLKDIDEFKTEKVNSQTLLYIIKQPEKADIDYSGQISIIESFLLGIALSANALATGFGAGMTGISILGMTLSVMIFSFLTIFIGVHFGKKYVSNRIGDKGAAIAGILLLIIGIYEILC